MVLDSHDRRTSRAAAFAGGPTLTAGDIDAAARRISSVAAVTPLEQSPRLSAATKTTVWL